MRSTGIIRQLDSLGRVVLPIELRRSLNIAPKDLLEIMVDGNTVVLRKYEASCSFCGSDGRLVSYRGKLICRRCLREIKEL